MSLKTTRSGRLALTASLVLALSPEFAPAALAEDNTQAAETVMQSLAGYLGEKGKVDLKYEEPEEKDGQIIYSDVTLTSNTPDGGTATIGTLAFTDLAVGADSTAAARLVELSDITIENKDKSGATISHVVLHDVSSTLPRDAKTPTPNLVLDNTGKIGGVELTNLVATDETGKTVASVDSVLYTGSDFIGNMPRSTNVTVGHMIVDAAAANNTARRRASPPADGANAPQGEDVLAELGYTKLDFSLSAASTWNDQTGEANLNNFVFSGKDMGALKANFTMGGVTPDVYATFKNHPGENLPPEVLKKLTLIKGQLTFDDSSLTRRVLAMLAKQAGQPTDQYVRQLVTLVPVGAMMLPDPALQMKFAKVAQAFLANPGSVTVSVAPAKPASLADLNHMMETAPQDLPHALNVDLQGASH